MRKLVVVLLGATLLLTSCYRTGRDTWEDTKTCGRYMSKGLRSLMGQHTDGSEYAFFDNWSTQNDEFVPLPGTSGASEFVTLSDCAPISRECPGDPGSRIPGIDSFYTPDGKLAELFSNVHFDTDNYTIQGENNYRYLHEIAKYMIKNPNTYVFVEGHADERGAASYNLALGSRRSNAVRAFLIQNGVNADQLFSISYGKERPLVQGHDKHAWDENRRAQFKLYVR